MKNVDLPRVSIIGLPQWDKWHLLRRQFPRHARKLLDFEVRRWEDEPWVAVYKYVDDDERELLASAKLLSKPRRYDNRMVEWATIDPELIAFTLLRL